MQRLQGIVGGLRHNGDDRNLDSLFAAANGLDLCQEFFGQGRLARTTFPSSA